MMPLPPALESFHLERGDYRLSFARTQEELEKLQRLRYEIFNLELNEGLSSSAATGRDVDEFDDVCHHLYLQDKKTAQPVGTYRMQSALMAAQNKGLYSAREYEFAQFPTETLAGSVELGRACIADGHRRLPVLFLLWQGLAAYLQATRMRYLLGCGSITSQDEKVAAHALAHIRATGHMHPHICLPAQPAYRCQPQPAQEVPKDFRLPKLFNVYLSYGAKICSHPALDREFKTIDFLTLFDLEELKMTSLNYFFNFGAKE